MGEELAMFFVRVCIGAILALAAFAIFRTMIGSQMGQGGAVLFMLLTVSLISLSLQIRLPSTAAVKQQSGSPRTDQRP